MADEIKQSTPDARPSSAQTSQSSVPDGTTQTSQPSAAPAAAQSRTVANSAYVRTPRPHKTQPAVDDFQAPEQSPQDVAYTHESSYTLSSRNPIQSRSYRKARSDQAKVRQELKYGQYLSVPKGSREIFSSRERQATKRRVVIGIIAVAIVVILLLIFWPK